MYRTAKEQEQWIRDTAKQGMYTPNQSNKELKDTARAVQVMLIPPLPDHKNSKEYKKLQKDKMLKNGLILAVGVSVGYGISKLFKTKPLISMAVAPIALYSVLVVLDHLAWNRAIDKIGKK